MEGQPSSTLRLVDALPTYACFVSVSYEGTVSKWVFISPFLCPRHQGRMPGAAARSIVRVPYSRLDTLPSVYVGRSPTDSAVADPETVSRTRLYIQEKDTRNDGCYLRRGVRKRRKRKNWKSENRRGHIREAVETLKDACP